MHFYGDFADADVVGDLLIEATNHHQGHYLSLARGRLSKQIAGDIGIAESTVKVYRSRAMQKMKAHSLPELGRMADKLKLVPEEPPQAS